MTLRCCIGIIPCGEVRTLLAVADGADQQRAPLQHATTRRFSEKSPAEKEELYERIASQLISIGDSYAISTPPNGAESDGEYCLINCSGG